MNFKTDEHSCYTFIVFEIIFCIAFSLYCLFQSLFNPVNQNDKTIIGYSILLLLSLGIFGIKIAHTMRFFRFGKTIY